jgi:hypothetical protein
LRDADHAADAELNDVNGGYLAPIIAAGSFAFLVVMGWDNVGSKETQAAALGMSHLL